MATKLVVNVTEDHIEAATKRDSRSCMIAEAIKAEHPHFRKVMVDLATIRWTNPRTKKRYVCLTPAAAGIALVAFDQGQKVEPFVVAMKTVQVTPVAVSVRDADGQLSLTPGGNVKRNKTHGAKKLNVDLEIAGGKPLPTGHLSNVRVSRNDVRVFGRRLLRG